MSYYGLKRFSGFIVSKTLLPANTTIVSLPQSANTLEITRVDAVYVTPHSGSVGIIDSNPDTSLVGTILADTLVLPKNAWGNNTLTIQSGNTDVESVQVAAESNSAISNCHLAIVDGTYELPAEHYAVLADGVVQTTSNNLDSNNDLYVFNKRNSNTSITGNGRLLVFQVTAL